MAKPGRIVRHFCSYLMYLCLTTRTDTGYCSLAMFQILEHLANLFSPSFACFQAVQTKVNGFDSFGVNSQLALTSNFLFFWNLSTCGKCMLPSIIKIELHTRFVLREKESFAGAGPSMSISGSFTDIGTDAGRKRRIFQSPLVLPRADCMCLFPTLSLWTAYWQFEIGYGDSIYTTEIGKHQGHFLQRTSC